MLRIGPGTAGAIEALRLIHPAERRCTFQRRPLHQKRLAERLECAPAAGGLAIGTNRFRGHLDISRYGNSPVHLRIAQAEPSFQNEAEFRNCTRSIPGGGPKRPCIPAKTAPFAEAEAASGN